MIKAEGPQPASIMLVGGMPRKADMRDGKPFGGGHGKVLDALLRTAGIARHRCRVSYIMDTLPPQKSFGSFYQVDGLVESRVEAMKAEVQATKPKVVVLLGANALHLLAGRDGINNWRGSVIWSSILGCKVIPTYHPENVMRQWGLSPLAVLDFKKALKESQHSGLVRKQRTLVTEPSVERIMVELDRMEAGGGKVSFDIETTYNDVIMTSIAFADCAEWAICIPFARGSESYWDLDTEMLLLSRIKRFLESEKVGKIAQNAQFDMGVLRWRYGIEVKPLVIDTMAAFHTLYSELPKSLDTLCSIYTDQPYYAYKAKAGGKDFYEYNCLDACVTWECAEAIEKELKDEGIYSFYHTYVHPLIEPLLCMQLRGVRINTEARDLMRKHYEAEYQALHERLERIIGHELNPNSPKQVGDFLYDELGLPEKRSRKTGGRTVDAKSLAELAARHSNPVFDMILRLRELQKIIGTYLQIPLGEDGRMHTSFNIGGSLKKAGGIKSAPKTGRLSSSYSIITASGTNLQNQPKSVRKLFLPDPGYLIAEADLSQAEARVVAWEAGERTLMRMFREGRDVHKFVASIIFDVPEAEVTTEQRQFAKRHVHALNYGETPNGFAYQTGLTLAKAKEVSDKYFAAFPALQHRKVNIENSLKRSRVMRIATGRVRRFYGRAGNDLLKDAFACSAQATVADILNLSLIKLDKLFNANPIGALLLQVHDSVVFQFLDGHLEEVKEMVREAFDTPVTINGEGLVIPVELEVGPNWGELEEVSL